MDAQVNDFLNEINEIAPLSAKEEQVWEKCFDEESGYYYYWNTKTNQVTWNMPSEYKPKNKTKKPVSLYIPPRTAPLFPSTSGLLPPKKDAIKIYKIGENTTDSIIEKKKIETEILPQFVKEHKIGKPVSRRRSSSEDEKIVLISSYGEDSESDVEEKDKNESVNNAHVEIKPLKTVDDDMVLKEVEIIHKIDQINTNDTPKTTEQGNNDNKTISGFSLIAGYSDSEDEDINKGPIVTQEKENNVAHSTLFPIREPIDVKEFETPSTIQNSINSNDFDSKAFQRKRRIGVALINTGSKRNKTENVDNENSDERKGLGFKCGDNTKLMNSNLYPGFKSGGVMFVKKDVLNPTTTTTQSNDESSEISVKEIDDTYTMLVEKLGFLSEGREPVLPVQEMLIQLQTLYTALKTGDLKGAYLQKWLNNTSADLVKLEKETAPEGWLLQWDRSHKRYYYENESTGESQWEYPQSDVTRCDEAMDICTTPPPNGAEQAIQMSPPLPPKISSPSPPSPPVISNCAKKKTKKCDNIPLPEAKPPEKKSISIEQPLPPGVDEPPENQTETKHDLDDALNSFYSDIAAIESSSSPPLPIPPTVETKVEIAENTGDNHIKKKKKTKVKLVEGIAMKKKGVSKLVEKWKNVQLSYND